MPRAARGLRPSVAFVNNDDVPGVVLSSQQLLAIDVLAQRHGGEGRPGPHAAAAASAASADAAALAGSSACSPEPRGERRAEAAGSSSSSGREPPPLEEHAAVDGVLQGPAVAVLHHEPGLREDAGSGLPRRCGRRGRGKVVVGDGGSGGRVSGPGSSGRGWRPREDDGALGRLEGLDDARVGLCLKFERKKKKKSNGE